MPARFRGSIRVVMKVSSIVRSCGLVVALAAPLAALPGCASSAPAVNLSTSWPQAPSDYKAAQERWTRRQVIHQGLDHVLSVSATALSADFRAAYVAEKTRRLELSPEERTELTTAEKTADADNVEFEVLFSTNRSEWNDLAKYPRTMWRVALVGDDGRVVLPSKIAPDKRVRAELEEWFPKPYIVTFPRVAADGKPILGEGSKQMKLEIACAFGRTELVWSAN